MYKHLWIVTILVFVISIGLNAQEICNNGIDDDGDSYPDCFDSDCPCYAPFTCDETALYQSVGLIQNWPGVGVNGNYILTQLNSNPLSLVPLHNLSNNGFSGSEFNSIGYNPNDNFIYGINPQYPYNLWRINNNGTIRYLGNVSGLSGRNQAGTFDKHGNYYVCGSSLNLYNININNKTATLIGNMGARFDDIAFNPVDNFLYGWRTEPYSLRGLYRIDPSNAVITPIGPRNPNYWYLGAVYFDVQGNLLAYGNDINFSFYNQETFLSIDVQTGVVTNLGQSYDTYYNDGCSCPFGITLDKAGPQTANANDTITYEFTITNLSAQWTNDITFTDILHSGLIYVSDPVVTSGGISITGNTIGQTSASLTINNLSVDSIATFTIDVYIPCNYEQPVNYGNIANLTNVVNPMVLPDTIFSDDPNTPALGDITYTQIYPAAISTIIDTIGPVNICQGQNYVLPNGNIANASGYYYIDTISFSCLFDNIIVINLNLIPEYNDTITATICPGETFAGYSSTGTYVDVFTSINGCDSIRTLNLTVSVLNCNLEFKCDGNLLLTQYHNQPPTIIYGVDVSAQATFTYLQSYNLVLNSFGYNRKDNFLYAYNTNARNIVRLYSDGTFTTLGWPLGGGGHLVAGAVDSAGVYTLTSNSVRQIYRVNVTGPMTYLSTAIKFYTNGQLGNPQFTDIVFHPQTNKCYGYELVTKRMATIDPVTGGVSLFGPVHPYATGIGALFFTASGILYGYTDGLLLKTDISTGAIIVDAQGPPAIGLDGCSCPYTVGFTKEVIPALACPGDTVTYQFTIYNSTLDNLSNIDFSDILPSDLTIVTNPSNTFGGSIVNGGIGTNSLKIQGMTIPANSSIFSYDVVLSGSLSGGDTLRNQAVLNNLPSTLGDSVLSDNPLTVAFSDSTTLVVNEVLASITSVDASCFGVNDGSVEVIVSSGVGPYDYAWNIPGATQIIQNLASGNYSVTVTDHVGCFITLTDTVFEPAEIRDTIDISICYGESYFSGGANQTTSGVYQDTLTAGNGCDSLITTNLTVNSIVSKETSNWVFGQNAWLDFSSGLPVVNNGSLMDASYEGCASISDAAGNLLFYTDGIDVWRVNGGVHSQMPNGFGLFGHPSATQSSVIVPNPSLTNIYYIFTVDTKYGYNGFRVSTVDLNLDNGNGDVVIVPSSSAETFKNQLLLNSLSEKVAAVRQCGSDSIWVLAYDYNNHNYNAYLITGNGISTSPVVSNSNATYQRGTGEIGQLKFAPGGAKVATAFFDAAPSAGKVEVLDFNFSTGRLSNPVIYNTINGKSVYGVAFSSNGMVLYYSILRNQGNGLYQIDLNTGTQQTIYLSADPKFETSSLQLGPEGRIYIALDSVNTSFGLDQFSSRYIGIIQSPNVLGLACNLDTFGIILPDTMRVYRGLPNFLEYCRPIPEVDVAICSGERYLIGGAFQTTAGVYLDTLTAANGCDSIITTILTILPHTFTTVDVSICNGENYFVGGVNQTSTGSYQDTLLASNGCDSVITINLTINNSSVSSINPTACDSYTSPSGNYTWATSGSYTDTIPNSFGCDSVITINLTINNSSASSINPVACDSYTSPSGNYTWITSGTYMETLPNAFGCDSIITVNLTVKSSSGPGTFAAAINYPVSSAPNSVSTGDFNGDGFVDMAVTNYYSNNVSILLGSGSGTFAAAVNYPVSTRPFSVTNADFNGDGFADLAVANFSARNVSILLGNGTGTFAASINYPVGTGPVSISTSDFNGDGFADLVTANYSSNNISVLLGNGSGTFAAAVNYPSGNNPYSVSTSDFNGDGFVDLAVANFSSNSVSIFLGSGTGIFAAAVNYTAGNMPRYLCTNDFNGDGFADLAVINWGSNNVSILLGSGTGSFATAVNYPVGTGPASVSTADFNDDGIADLAVANYTASNVSILLGNGSGTFATAVSYTAGNRPYSITPADFNSDGFVDLAVVNYGSNTVSVLLNSGYSTINPTACNSYTSPSGNYIWTTSGTYKDTVPNANGCDSVIIINLTVLPNAFTTADVSICVGDSHFAAGANQTSTGAYQDTLVATNGCDSVITTNLTMMLHAYTLIDTTICEGDNLGGVIFFNDTTLIDSLVTANSCDSVVTTNITTLICCPEPIILCDTLNVSHNQLACGDFVLPEPNVFSNCDLASVTSDWAGGPFPIGATVVTWFAENIFGYRDTCEQVVIYAPSTLLSSYTIIGLESVELKPKNDVVSGSVGVMDTNGTAYIANHTSVMGVGSEVRATNIISFRNTQILNPVNAVTSVTLPPFESNTTSGGFDIIVDTNQTVTLTGYVYGTIRLKKDAKVIFSNPFGFVNVQSILAYDSDLSSGTVIAFNQCTSVRVANRIDMGPKCTINPDSLDVIFYVEGANVDINHNPPAVIIGPKSIVIADFYVPNGRFYVHPGSRVEPVVMTGIVIAKWVYGSTDVIWNISVNCRSTYQCPKLPFQPKLLSNIIDANREEANMTIYPNPFSDKTTVQFNLAESDKVLLTMYNMSGQQVKTIFAGSIEGKEVYQFDIESGNLLNGVYFLRLSTETNSFTQKMILMK